MSERFVEKIAAEMQHRTSARLPRRRSCWRTAPPCRSSPATARRPPASLDEVAITADPRPAGAARRAGRAPRGHPQVAGRARAAHRRASRRRSRRPRRWRRWRTSTCPTAPSAAPGPRSPGRRASSRWPTCSVRRTRRPSIRCRGRGGLRQTPEKGVASAEDALAGARDIIAERVSEDAGARARPCATCSRTQGDPAVQGRGRARRRRAQSSGTTSTGASRLATAPSHRMLAMRRGENEGFLDAAHRAAGGRGAGACSSGMFVKDASPAAEQVRLAVQDGYKRLLAPSMETEIAPGVQEARRRGGHPRLRRQPARTAAGPAARAEERAGHRPGLPHRLQGRLPRPAGQAAAPRRRSIPTQSERQARRRPARRVRALCERFEIEAIAIGNGTAGRETEAFVRGARAAGRASPSSWSTRAAPRSTRPPRSAREEFPDQDVTVRGAVSIGRRLMDPLAELVKIDPKSIGVGQYQHDVDQAALKRAPGRRGGELRQRRRRGGEHGQQAAAELRVRPRARRWPANIVAYRNEHGPFRSRARAAARCRGSGPRPSSRPPASCASATARTRWTPAPCTRRATPSWSAMAARPRLHGGAT